MADNQTTAADRLVAYMREHTPPRTVYLAQRGGYLMSFPGDESPRRQASPDVIAEALRRGLIRVRYPGLECWDVADQGR